VVVTFHVSVAGVLKWARRFCATGSAAAKAEGQATSLIVSSAWPRCHSILSLPAGVASEGDFEHRVLEPQGLPMRGPSHDFLKPVVRYERKSIAQSDAKLSQFFRVIGSVRLSLRGSASTAAWLLAWSSSRHSLPLITDGM
jgi:hypothetical protein